MWKQPGKCQYPSEPVFFLFLKLESLRSKHEVLRKDLEASHADKMESITQQYEQSLEGKLSLFLVSFIFLVLSLCDQK